MATDAALKAGIPFYCAAGRAKPDHLSSLKQSEIRDKNLLVIHALEFVLPGLESSSSLLMGEKKGK